MKIKTIMSIPSWRMAISKEIHDNALANTGEKGPCAHCWWEYKPTLFYWNICFHSHFSRRWCSLVEHYAGSYFLSAQWSCRTVVWLVTLLKGSPYFKCNLLWFFLAVSLWHTSMCLQNLLAHIHCMERQDWQ